VQFRQAENWPTVAAIIESCRFVVNDDPDGTSYQVETRYSYVVDGISYTGDRIAFDYPGSTKEDEVRTIYKKLCNAKKVQAQYNPLRPEECVLASGYNRSYLLKLIFSITWLLFVTGMAFLWRMSSGKDKTLLSEITVIEKKGNEDNVVVGNGK